MAKIGKNRKKKARNKIVPKPQKRPKISDASQISFEKRKIRWSFSLIDMHGPFGWARCSLPDLENILKQKLSSFETMTWEEIAGHRHHLIAVDNLSTEARKRLSQLRKEDYSTDEVFSLALGGKQRVIGIRDRDVFKLLWWDPEHEVCPSKLKHT